jgi:DNA-binding transcriptional ArsR family regulator
VDLYKSRLAHHDEAGHAVGVDGQAILRALAEPRRQAMLRLIRDQPRSAGEIGTHFAISQQAVSQHLQLLAGVGLVRVQREGRRRLYEVDPEGLESLDAFLADLWPAGLRRLKEAVEADAEAGLDR